MDVAGRCDVETWAELGFAGISCTPKIKFSGETDVFLCIGCDEVYVFSAKERKLTVGNPYCTDDAVKLHCKASLWGRKDNFIMLYCVLMFCCRRSSSFLILWVTWFRVMINSYSTLPVGVEFIVLVYSFCYPGIVGFSITSLNSKSIQFVKFNPVNASSSAELKAPRLMYPPPVSVSCKSPLSFW